MLLGGGRLVGTCWKSACRQINFRHIGSVEQGVILSPQKQAFIQIGSNHSFSNITGTSFFRDKDAPTVKSNLYHTSQILSEKAIRIQTGLQTSTKDKSSNSLSSYSNLFAARFAVLRNLLPSRSVYSRLFSSSIAGREKQQRVVHSLKPSLIEEDAPKVPSDESPVPSDFIFWFIMCLNLTVFAVWQLAINQAQHGNANLFVSMFANFTSSLFNISQGRFWTLLTSCISHIDYAHFFLNMLTYFFFGRAILTLVGGRSFLFFYFLAGLASSTFSLFMEQQGFGSNRQEQGKSSLPNFSVGASGSIIAIVTCFSLIKPKEWLLFMFFIPVPARILIPGLFMYDLYGIFGSEPNKAWWNKNIVIDSAGHIGGFIAGRLYWIYKLRRFRVMW